MWRESAMTTRDDQMTPEERRQIEEHADRLIAETHQSSSGTRAAEPLAQDMVGNVESPGAAAGDTGEALAKNPSGIGDGSEYVNKPDLTTHTGGLADNASLARASEDATDRPGSGAAADMTGHIPNRDGGSEDGRVGYEETPGNRPGPGRVVADDEGGNPSVP
jgi:hypothetical protein